MDYLRGFPGAALCIAWPDQGALAGQERRLMRTSLPRFIVTCLLLVSTALLLRARGSNEVFPHRSALGVFPREINGLIGTDVAIEKDALEKLGPGDFLLRVYTDQKQS